MSDAPPAPPGNPPASSQGNRTQFGRNMPGLRTPLQFEELPPQSNVVYGIQIGRAIVLFVMGCCMACELTGIRLWRSLEKSI